MRSAEEWVDEIHDHRASNIRLMKQVQDDALETFLVDWDDGVPYCPVCRHAIDQSGPRGVIALLGTCRADCRVAMLYPKAPTT